MAVAHLALVDALARTGISDPADLKSYSPVPKLKLDAAALSSPFHSHSLTPVSSRGPSPAPSLAPSFHTAHSVTGTIPSPANAAVTSVPHRRPSPAPITIPAATVDQPLFSAYPFSASNNEPSSSSSPSQRTHLTAPPFPSPSAWPTTQSRPSISLEPSNSRRTWDSHHDYDERTSSTRSRSTFLGSQASLSNLSRCRSATAINFVKRVPDSSSGNRGHSDTAPATPIIPPPRTSSRRRASLHADDQGIERWRELGAMASSMDTTRTAYDFLREEGQYTLESVSAVSGVRPLSPSIPSPPPRSPALIQSKDSSALFRFAALSISTDRLGDHPDAEIDDFVKEANADINAAADAVSIVSEPLTSSPSAMTKSFPPSTKTSLSRSARSGKEGSGASACANHNDEDNTATTTTATTTTTAGTAADGATTTTPHNDHQSKESKRSAKERGLTEKRRMILLEIVETEITYVHDLQALVHIYLPQLAALPHVSERIHSLVVRNTTDLLQFHVQFAAHLVDILKYCGMGYDEAPAHVVDTVTKRVADLFIREVTSFSLYNDYCAGSTAAGPLIRSIAHRSDYDAFEKRCQYVASTTANPTLRDLLYNRTPRPMRSRLRFQDILISPVQRVCRYPLLLSALLADVDNDLPRNEVIAAVEHAQAIMRAVAANADDARQWKDAELKSIVIADRLEPHPAIHDEFMEHLGVCRLGGALEVLYHHPVHAPLEAPVKVKYLAAFLYRGYLILAKIRRGNRFEAKHYLPLEAFELIDITEGFLPHSIRLTLGEHNFDLAASCDAEKEVWANELVAARNESIIPPFELPSSVPLFGPPVRQEATDDLRPVPEGNKRHTVTGLELLQGVEDSPSDSIPSGAPTPSTTTSEYRRSQPATLLLRRASGSQRIQVDRALSDIFFESLSTARSKAQHQYTNSGFDSRRSSSLFDTPILRRRLSFADSRTALDVLAAPEVRGAVMPARIRPRPRTMLSNDGSLDIEGMTSGDISRNTSFSSISDIPLRNRRSSLSLRRGFDMGMTSSRGHRRQSASISSLSNLDGRSRARSVPNSPAVPAVTQFEPVAEPVGEHGEIIENLSSPPATARPRVPKRMCSDESFVLVPDCVPTPLPTIVSPGKGSPPRGASSGSIRRSMSIFARRSPSSPSLHDMAEETESTKSSSSSRLTISPKLTTKTLTKNRSSSVPSTPDGSHTPKRRRSMRLFGQLRGFTPI